jgi:SAM-dependent methyltransferase
LERETALASAHLHVLHWAPESALAARFASRPNLDYVTADLAPGAAMAVMDITAIPRPDESIDVLIASHVLEHVPDDGLALSEIFRVLRPGGMAALQHPIDYDRAVTYEDPAITEPADRERAFGQDDHVRVYGRDFDDRLRQAGFDVELRRYREELSAEERHRYRLDEQGTEPRRQPSLIMDDIYVCRKRPVDTAT